MNLEAWALIVSIVSGIIAVTAIIQSIVLRRWTTSETSGQLNFIIQLVVNSAADPDAVRRMLEDYGRAGEWRAKVSKRPDGKYGLDFTISVGGGDVKPSGKLEGHKV